MFQPFFFLVMLVLYTLSSFAPVNGIPVQKHPAKSSLTEECESLSGPEDPNGASSLFQDAAPNAHNEFQKMESQSKIDVSPRGLHPKNVDDIADEHACRKVDRMVNAADDSIVHPRRFNAYQCVGKCNIKQLQNVNNYARVTLNMKNKVNSTDGMAACCVPVKLRPIRILYFEKETLEIRSLDNMIVEECGCYQIFQ
ncbi:nodal homolog [Pocillopora verrucosa]|uniref:nodal homolog n=1 Tax=Pocillopora verrucosa TaxID=203993 RepID=UPI003340B3E8